MFATRTTYTCLLWLFPIIIHKILLQVIRFGQAECQHVVRKDLAQSKQIEQERPKDKTVLHIVVRYALLRDRLHQQLLGQIHEDRSWLAMARQEEDVVYDKGKHGGALDLVGPIGAGLGQTHDRRNL